LITTAKKEGILMSNIPDELLELKSDILDGMISYIEVDDDKFDSVYSREDVDKCDAILIKYMTAVLTPAIYGDNEKIMAAVEDAVLCLNALNENCEHSLIETDQREGICEFIISVAAKAGLESEEYDITEEWREW
jgi:hypothetical protein